MTGSLIVTTGPGVVWSVEGVISSPVNRPVDPSAVLSCRSFLLLLVILLNTRFDIRLLAACHQLAPLVNLGVKLVLCICNSTRFLLLFAQKHDMVLSVTFTLLESTMNLIDLIHAEAQSVAFLFKGS